MTASAKPSRLRGCAVAAVPAAAAVPGLIPVSGDI